MNEEKITYHPYSLKKKISVNEWEFIKIIISSHYKEKHGDYMNDEKILKITKQLDERNDFIPHRQGKLPDGTI